MFAWRELLRHCSPRRHPGADPSPPPAGRREYLDIGRAHEFSIEAQKSLFFVSWWCFDCLVDARRAAATFINEHLGDAYLATRETDKALERYKQALSLYKKEEKKAAIRKKIEQLAP